MNNNLRELFSSIANHYDALNTVLSLNLDKGWRQKAVDFVRIKNDAKILDLCTGTAETAIAFAKKYKECKVDAVDFSPAMLSRARKKITRLGLAERIHLLEADVFDLPLARCSYDAVAISFGLRNLGDHQQAMTQIVAFLKEGGTALVLEFSPAAGTRFGKAADFYVKKLLPRIARICGGSRAAYAHLSSSIGTFLSPEEVLALMSSAGLKEVGCQNLCGGVVNFYYGQK